MSDGTEAELVRLRATVERLAVRLEQVNAERRSLAAELAEAQTQAERTLERLAEAHARELARRDAQHDARMARVAEGQRRALDDARAPRPAGDVPHTRKGRMT